MKQRLEAIIDACDESKADSATILRMLRKMHEEWKEPDMVIECGYIDKEDVPSKEEIDTYALTSVDRIINRSGGEKGDYKVSVILEKEDD